MTKYIKRFRERMLTGILVGLVVFAGTFAITEWAINLDDRVARLEEDAFPPGIWKLIDALQAAYAEIDRLQEENDALSRANP